MNRGLHQQGFSLIELVVVMGIGAILTMIAVPSYQASVIKSRRAEARVVINDTAQRLERCYTQFGAYDADDCPIDDADEIASQGGFYTLTVAIPDAATYTLTADPQGPQVDDEKCGWLSLTNTGVRDAESDDLEHCW
jgi:type IV pilus assembly protein PilE